MIVPNLLCKLLLI